MISAMITGPARLLRGIWSHMVVWNRAKKHLDSKVRVARKPEELEFLPAALEIVETPASPFLRWSAILIATLIVGSVVWSYVGKIDIVAVAQGSIIPSGRVNTIQPKEIGVIKAIHVREGEHVPQGHLLIELDPSEALANIEQVQHVNLEAALEIKRLETALRLVNGEEAEFEFVGTADPSLVAVHHNKLKADISAFQRRLETLQERKRATDAEKREVISEIRKLRLIIPMLMERDEALTSLYEKGVTRKPELTSVRIQLIEMRENLEIQKIRTNKLDASIASILSEQNEVVAAWRSQILEQLLQARKQYQQSKSELAKIETRKALNLLRSPVSGHVKELKVNTKGGVVTPAEVLLSIVPDNQPLEVEAFVLNKDIGFIGEGQEVAIKIESFPFTKYGLIDGVVKHISADAVEREGIGLVFPIRAELMADSIQVGNREVALAPGMSVTAEVKTGKRRILDYFLSPIAKYQSESLREM